MTKTEKHKQLTREIILALKDLCTIIIDFEDEGHGYFTFSILNNNKEFIFDMSRKDFDITSHILKGDKNFEEAKTLEKSLNNLIEMLLNVPK